MSYEEDKRDKIITKKVNDFRLWKHSHNLKNQIVFLLLMRRNTQLTLNILMIITEGNLIKLFLILIL